MARVRRLPAKTRRRQILETARAVFAAEGYAKASTADLAKAVGVSEPALYRYFASKKDLFLATIRDTGARLLEIWQDIAYQVEDPLDTLWAIGVHYYDHLESRTGSMKLLFQALSEADDPQVRQALRENFGAFVDFVAETVEEGQARGIIRKDLDPRLVGWQLLGIGLTLDLIHLLGLRDELDRRKAERWWSRLYLETIRSRTPRRIPYASEDVQPLRQPPGPEVAEAAGGGWKP